MNNEQYLRIFMRLLDVNDIIVALFMTFHLVVISFMETLP